MFVPNVVIYIEDMYRIYQQIYVAMVQKNQPMNGVAHQSTQRWGWWENEAIFCNSGGTRTCSVSHKERSKAPICNSS